MPHCESSGSGPDEADGSGSANPAVSWAAQCTLASQPIYLAMSCRSDSPPWDLLSRMHSLPPGLLVTAHRRRTHRVVLRSGSAARLPPLSALEGDAEPKCADAAEHHPGLAQIEVFQRLGEITFDLASARLGFLDIVVRAGLEAPEPNIAVVRLRLRTLEEGDRAAFARKVVQKRAADRRGTLEEYLTRTRIKEHLHDAAQELLKTLPDDPFLFLARYLVGDNNLDALMSAAAGSAVEDGVDGIAACSGTTGQVASLDLRAASEAVASQNRLNTEPRGMPSRAGYAHRAIAPGSIMSSPRGAPEQFESIGE